MKARGSDSDASTSASEGEEDSGDEGGARAGEAFSGPQAGRGMGSRAKAAALELLEGAGAGWEGVPLRRQRMGTSQGPARPASSSAAALRSLRSAAGTIALICPPAPPRSHRQRGAGRRAGQGAVCLALHATCAGAEEARSTAAGAGGAFEGRPRSCSFVGPQAPVHCMSRAQQLSAARRAAPVLALPPACPSEPAPSSGRPTARLHPKPHPTAPAGRCWRSWMAALRRPAAALAAPPQAAALPSPALGWTSGRSGSGWRASRRRRLMTTVMRAVARSARPGRGVGLGGGHAGCAGGRERGEKGVVCCPHAVLDLRALHRLPTGPRGPASWRRLGPSPAPAARCAASAALLPPASVAARPTPPPPAAHMRP